MQKRHLTKRAADWWDSSRFTSIFLASSFPAPKLCPRLPTPGNASRWAVYAYSLIN